jgi:hypothetical protein
MGTQSVQAGLLACEYRSFFCLLQKKNRLLSFPLFSFGGGMTTTVLCTARAAISKNPTSPRQVHLLLL